MPKGNRGGQRAEKQRNIGIVNNNINEIKRISETIKSLEKELDYELNKYGKTRVSRELQRQIDGYNKSIENMKAENEHINSIYANSAAARKDVQTAISVQEDAINNRERRIKQLNGAIKSLQDDLEYDKKRSNGHTTTGINEKKQAIENYKSEIKAFKEEIKRHKEKIKKLKNM